MIAADASHSPFAGDHTTRAAHGPWLKLGLVAGLAWALLVIVPDVYRLHWPLAAFDFSVDNDGVVYAAGATPEGTSAAGEVLRPGDRIALAPGACWQPTSARCRDFLALFGGMGGLTYVRSGTSVLLPVVHADGRVGTVFAAARDRALTPLTKVLLALDELAGVVVIWLAFRLAWDRPGRMTLGMFLFAMWFNPGQYFAFYAWLQAHPVLLLAQEALQAIAQGAGYAGFLIFALRFPHDRRAHRLRPVERGAVALGALLALLQLASFANTFGHPTETVTRVAILGGHAVALAAFAVVVYRMKYQSPLDYQRMRWVKWGCLIGLPAFIFADGNEATSLWARLVWSNLPASWTPGEPVFEAAYLASGILTLFICTAVRHRRILNVSLELRAVAATAIVLVVAGVIEEHLREPLEHSLALIGISAAVQFYAAVGALVVLGVVTHEGAHRAGELFNVSFHRARRLLGEKGRVAEAAGSVAELEGLLEEVPREALGLASAQVFADAAAAMAAVYAPSRSRRAAGEVEERQSWIAALERGQTVHLPLPPESIDDTPDVDAPAIAIPVAFGGRLYAVATYSVHATGAALDGLEIRALEAFAAHAAIGYERLATEALEAEVRTLRARAGLPASDVA